MWHPQEAMHARVAAGAPPALRKLYDQALDCWVPRWFSAFADAAAGGFHERLDSRGVPLPMGYKRLLTQCRQIFVYSHACLITGDRTYEAPLRAALAFMCRHYRGSAPGTWAFSRRRCGEPHNDALDLYAHAFVILALSALWQVTSDPGVRRLLDATLAAVDTYFRAPVGFYERLDAATEPLPGLRRQNAHMHLFEACLWSRGAADSALVDRLADEILDLFMSRFFATDTNTLVEFFSPDWSPHPEAGDTVEPGHHYEWVWLLHRYVTERPAAPQRARIIAAARSLKTWADRHATAGCGGAVSNALRRSDGKVLQPGQRIWHLTEALKADTILHHTARQAARCIALRNHLTPSGWWVESKHPDGTPATSYMPGTTPYHLLMGITEATRLAAAPNVPDWSDSDQFDDNNVGWPRAAGANSASPL